MIVDRCRLAELVDTLEQADLLRWRSLQGVWAPVIVDVLKRDAASRRLEDALANSRAAMGGWRL
ncbi:MAG TPA: hypothetical protein VEK76_02080 [Candidatus Binatia bacterium]|nr:hypothetical protein [Candidatus Binatia bacterium]